MCDLFVSLGGLVEAQAQPIETIQQDAAVLGGATDDRGEAGRLPRAVTGARS